MTADAQTYFAIDLEATRGSEEAEGRGAKGVGWGEGNAAMVDSGGEGRGGRRAPDGKVPLKEGSVAEWMRVYVWGRVAVEFGSFTDYIGEETVGEWVSG